MDQVKVTERVQKQLFELQDVQYRDFQAKLLPTIDKETIIGVRMPVLRKFAKGYGKTEEAKEFLKILPHQYYDENNLHGLLIEQLKDYDRCLEELERFFALQLSDLENRGILSENLEQWLRLHV